jgi:cytochrome c-type biogenesis protein CcmH
MIGALSHICGLAGLILLVSMPAFAVQPGELLKDPALEARARAISKELRCPVCQNESIDESHAEVARDLRLLVRERVSAGDTNDEALSFLVARYGEFILLNPPAKGSTLILWFAGPAMLLFGCIGAAAYLRGRALHVPADELSINEAKRLTELLKK